MVCRGQNENLKSLHKNHPGATGFTQCPICSGKVFYRLGDGRLLCKGCRKKFSIKERKSRLDSDCQKDLALYFWQKVSADRSAGILGLNKKTVQRFYHRFRIAMARENVLRIQKNRSGQNGDDYQSCYGGDCPGGQKIPVFWVANRLKGVCVFMPPKNTGGEGFLVPAPSVMVYTFDEKNVELLNIDEFAQEFIDGENSPQPSPGHAELLKFWPYARQGLKHYRGGFRSRFGLYLTEMAFRFNYREERPAIKRLLELC